MYQQKKRHFCHPEALSRIFFFLSLLFFPDNSQMQDSLPRWTVQIDSYWLECILLYCTGHQTLKDRYKPTEFVKNCCYILQQWARKNRISQRTYCSSSQWKNMKFVVCFFFDYFILLLLLALIFFFFFGSVVVCFSQFHSMGFQ